MLKENLGGSMFDEQVRVNDRKHDPSFQEDYLMSTSSEEDDLWG